MHISFEWIQKNLKSQVRINLKFLIFSSWILQWYFELFHIKTSDYSFNSKVKMTLSFFLKLTLKKYFHQQQYIKLHQAFSWNNIDANDEILTMNIDAASCKCPLYVTMDINLPFSKISNFTILKLIKVLKMIWKLSPNKVILKSQIAARPKTQ